MSSEPAVAAAERALHGTVVGAGRIGGGDINDAWALEIDGGERAFLKSRSAAAAAEYEAEAAGLRWLAAAGGLRTPQVLALVDEPGAAGLVLAWVEPGRLSPEGEEELGRGLAITHGAGAERFDALPPGARERPLRFGASSCRRAPSRPARPGRLTMGRGSRF